MALRGYEAAQAAWDAMEPEEELDDGELALLDEAEGEAAIERFEEDRSTGPIQTI